MSIAVLGAGSWGTALAISLSRAGRPVLLWGHLPADIRALAQDRENRALLPGVPFPDLLGVTSDLSEALASTAEVLIAVPSHAFAAVVEQVAPLLPPAAGVCWATKGFNPGDGRLLHEVAGQILGDRDLAVVSGPTFAGEVARGLPTAVTVASFSPTHAQRVADYLHTDRFRAYTQSDPIGVQVGGATKNVLAIAAGIADGLGFGANTRAALITRGLVELTRLGLALGGQMASFMGLAGLGDLALTCTDDQSRNRRLGLHLARGLDIAQARAVIGQEVEGIGAAQVVWAKAQSLGVEMPISAQVYRVLYEGVSPREAALALLERSRKAEWDD